MNSARVTPSRTPRRFAAASAALVRSPIINRSIPNPRFVCREGALFRDDYLTRSANQCTAAEPPSWQRDKGEGSGKPTRPRCWRRYRLPGKGSGAPPSHGCDALAESVAADAYHAASGSVAHVAAPTTSTVTRSFTQKAQPLGVSGMQDRDWKKMVLDGGQYIRPRYFD